MTSLLDFFEWQAVSREHYMTTFCSYMTKSKNIKLLAIWIDGNESDE